MACGAEVTTMSHGIVLLSYADAVLNPGPLKKEVPQPPRVHTTRIAKNS